MSELESGKVYSVSTNANLENAAYDSDSYPAELAKVLVTSDLNTEKRTPAYRVEIIERGNGSGFDGCADGWFYSDKDGDGQHDVGEDGKTLVYNYLCNIYFENGRELSNPLGTYYFYTLDDSHSDIPINISKPNIKPGVNEDIEIVIGSKDLPVDPTDISKVLIGDNTITNKTEKDGDDKVKITVDGNIVSALPEGEYAISIILGGKYPGAVLTTPFSVTETASEEPSSEEPSSEEPSSEEPSSEEPSSEEPSSEKPSSEEPSSEEPSSETPSETENPNTGVENNIAPTIFLLFISSISVCYVVVNKKQKEQSK